MQQVYQLETTPLKLPTVSFYALQITGMARNGHMFSIMLQQQQTNLTCFASWVGLCFYGSRVNTVTQEFP